MIPIKNQQEIEIMRSGGKILATLLNLLKKQAQTGIGTLELDKFAENYILSQGGQPAFKGYHGFPSTLCTCLNSEVVHAPAKPNRVLKQGDILSIDVGMRYPAKQGLITDMAITLPIGKIDKLERKLIKTTKDCLAQAVKIIKPGVYLGDVSHAIQTLAEKNNFNVVRDLSGHGVGKKLHEEPQVLNYGLKNTGPILQSGMTLAIEPMLTAGSYEIILAKDKQTYLTRDNSLSAHFEHTVLITPQGAEILTK
ncbi:type I methionyl aminopeptidase [Patescibacteria group bacterium]